MNCSHRYIWCPALLSLLACVALLSGCGRAETEPGTETQTPAASPADTPRVVATVGMIADLAERIAGEHATVDVLMQPGIDPHLYQPTRDDLAALLNADLVLYNGLKLEGRMTDALKNARGAGRAVVPVAESIPEDALLRLEEAELAVDGTEKLFDPHAWMDPSVWAQTVPVIRDALVEIDPDNAGAYTAAAEELQNELLELHAYAQRVLDTVPKSQRVLVTAHDAFGYFGRQYGFEVLGIQGISTQSEAGVRDIERLVAVLVERGVPAVFVESTVSERNVNALIAGAQARDHAVSVGGELFSDAMGPDGTPEGTYVGMLRHNVDTIAAALGGTVDAR
ncbi:MAG: zinc ABC transporter substrate-binding protein [Planctomycetota bacterium]